MIRPHYVKLLHDLNIFQTYTLSTDRPRRSVLRCSVFFHIRLGFDGNGSAQCIFASMFRHSDVRLCHQISGTKGLNQWISVPLFCDVFRLRHQISLTKELKIRHDLSVSLFCHEMTVSHADCVNATCLYSDCGIAYVLFKTFPQRWLNHLACKELVGG